MIRWLLWLCIIIWLFSKLKKLFFSDETLLDANNYADYTNKKTKIKNKHLKENAGDYVEYEEIK